MTYQAPDLTIPTERDADGELSIEWLHVSVCAPHGRPAVKQLDAPILSSSGQSFSWWLVQPITLYSSSFRKEWDGRYPSVATNWPICDICVGRFRRRLKIGAILAIFGVILIIACILASAKAIVATLLIVGIASIGSALAVVARAGTGQLTDTQLNRDLTAVVVRSPHPNFYEEASRAIRNRGYGGYPGYGATYR